MASTLWRGPEQDKVALRQYLAANGRSPTEAQDVPADVQSLAPLSGGGFLDGIGKLFGGGQASNNQTLAWLQSQGLDPGMASVVLGDKRLLQSFLLDRMKGGEPKKPIEVNGKLVDPTTYQVIADYSDPKTNAYSEREAVASRYGLQPGSPEYQRFILSGDLPSNRDQDPDFKNEMDLRKEYEGNPVLKNYAIVRDNYERIRAGVKLGTGAGDIATIFGYMKMLDPTSVVRENEQATAENAAGIPAKVRNIYNRLLEGDKLPPELRAAYMDAAAKIYAESSANLGDLNKRYGEVAGKWRIDPSRVLQQPEEYGPLVPISPDGPTPLPQPPATNSGADNDGWRTVGPGLRIRRTQ